MSKAIKLTRWAVSGRVGLLIPVLILMATCGFLFGRAKLAMTNRPSALIADAARLDLGNVGASTTFEWALPVTNVSNQNITVSTFQPSCGCTSVTPDYLEIEPGESRRVVLRINIPAAVGKHDTLRAPFDVTLRPHLVGFKRDFPVWTLKGTAVFPCLLESQQVSFTGAHALERGKPSHAKTILGRVLDRRYTVSVDSGSGDDVAALLPPDESGVFSLGVMPSSDRPVGPFDYVLMLRVRDELGQAVHAEPISIRGEVLSNHEFVPRELFLGPQVIGSPVSQTVMLRARRDEVRELACDSSGVRVEIVGESDEGALAIRITVVPAEAGPHSAQIYAVCEDNLNQVVRVDLPMTWHGTLAEPRQQASKDP